MYANEIYLNSFVTVLPEFSFGQSKHNKVLLGT